MARHAALLRRNAIIRQNQGYTRRGSIRKRSDGRWEGRYVAGHTEEGKPIRKSVLGKTQAEVKEKLKAALEEAGKVDVARADEYTVGAGR